MQQIKGWLQSFLSLLIISGACIRVWLPTWLDSSGWHESTSWCQRCLWWFCSANLRMSLPTSSAIWPRNDVCLSANMHRSIICMSHKARWKKVWAINFLRCLTVGVQNYWQQAVFVPQSRVFQLFQQSAPRKKTALYRRKTQVLQSISHNTFVQTTLSWAS